MRLYLFVLLTCLFSSVSAKNPKIIVENNLDMCVSVKVHVQEGGVREDTSIWKEINSREDIYLCKGERGHRSFKEIWKGDTWVWLEIKFGNSSAWVFNRALPLKKDEEIVCRLEVNALDKVNDNCCIEDRISIVFDHSTGNKNDVSSSFDLIPLGGSYLSLLEDDLYKDMHVYEASIPNEAGAEEKEFFGGMGIFRVDNSVDEKVGINFITSDRIDTRQPNTENENAFNSKKYTFYFTGLYLKEQLASFPYKLPNIDGIDVIESDYLYKCEYNFINLKKTNFEPKQFSDEQNVNALWNDLDPNIQSLFLEDYIYTARTSSDRETAEVLVFDKMITYDRLEIDFTEYETRSRIEPGESKSAIFTTKGPFYPTQKSIRSTPYSNRILAIGMSKSSKANNTILDNFIHAEAESYIRKTLQGIESNTKVTSDLLRKLSRFNKKGYLKTNKQTEIKNIVDFLKKVLEDFKKKQ